MEIAAELGRILEPDRVLSRWIDRIAYANDASVYRLVPRAVVRPRSLEEIRGLFAWSQRARVPLTFRTAGTSLSGQAVTDGVLVDVARYWREVEVLDGGLRVRVQPGAIGGAVNRRLAPFGAKIGPDPASINACMLGGILANNSSGMCCGVAQNAYHTLESIRFVLPSGVLVDTAEPEAEERFAAAAPNLARGLLELKARIESDAALVARIRRKYTLKNTMGYSLNAFLDYDRPAAILGRLMIGSEGTLGFIAEAVLRTVPDDPLKYTGLLFFADVPRACAAIAGLRDSGARALELMDRASLRAVQDQPGMPSRIRTLPPEAAALLVEYQSRTESDLAAHVAACTALLPGLSLAAEASFTRDPAQQAALWRVRKGLIPSVGACRARGTSFIIEDVVFPIEALADGVRELQALCARFGYTDAIVFGHAKDGNLHFVLTQAFDRPAEVARYDGFMQELAFLVAGRYGGALKAEHGTGRNMAPFVEAEWGREAYAIMRELKRLIDPDGLLNPGVILNEDPRAHLAHLKDLPEVEPEVDACIECGFCERMCPSRDLTLTPRQRIVVRREMAREAVRDPKSVRLAALESDYGYAALDTCATDGLCALACPVGIDTGALTKRLRHERHAPLAEELARVFAGQLARVEPLARLALRVGRVVRRDLPLATHPLPRSAPETPAAVYFPSCVTRVVGASPRQSEPRSLATSLVAVAARAGAPVRIPEGVAGICCGMPWSSKGYEAAHRETVAAAVAALSVWSDRGRLPVVVDTSPCAWSLKQAAPELRILDSIEFAHDVLLPRLTPRRLSRTVALHPVCSVQKLGLEDKLRALASACAASVEVPASAGCCGFAGDRGFLVPELTQAALVPEAVELAATNADGGYSSSRTCELGLERATGRPWRSFWYLLDEATRS
ncbi:MAG TPA: FAD-binding and (Fe-S)-binding domain-containing protein [Candidatus Polarisedimenticolaceae bacterium]|nr:FAD-binding and (Fe-S)-binding domain-containing protein [Candidatus Polarisedimenticolaceae bacterium]